MESNQQYISENEEEMKIPKEAVLMSGEIAESKTKKLASLDKGLRIVIDVRHYPGLVGMIDDLWDAEKEVNVLIWRT